MQISDIFKIKTLFSLCFSLITKVKFDNNLYGNHKIENIYKIVFSFITYTNIDSTKTTGIEASLLHKKFPYILEMDTIEVQCNFVGVDPGILKTDLETGKF